MSHSLPFSKYSGAGNDFILIDNRLSVFPIQDRPLIRSLCHRQKGIGADGIILVEPSSVADFRMRIFNSDGSEAEMCGNGMRCFALFLKELGFPEEHFRIETLARIHSVTNTGCGITVEMGKPSLFQKEIEVELDGSRLLLDLINTGVPHAILFVDDIEKIDVEKWGKAIRFHPRFQPQGTNVNFVAPDKEGSLRVRTYERGVEAETLACGTGAAAAAIAGAHRFPSMRSPITIRLRSGDSLLIAFTLENQSVDKLTMTGPAALTFRGQVNFLNHFNPLPENSLVVSAEMC